MKPELQRAAELAAEYIESFDTRKVSEGPDPQALRARLRKDLTADGLPPVQVPGAKRGALKLGAGPRLLQGDCHHPTSRMGAGGK